MVMDIGLYVSLTSLILRKLVDKALFSLSCRTVKEDGRESNRKYEKNANNENERQLFLSSRNRNVFVFDIVDSVG